MKKNLAFVIWIGALLMYLAMWAYSHYHQCLYEFVYKGTFHINNEVHKGNFHSYTFWYPELDPAGITVTKSEVRPKDASGIPISHTLFRKAPSFRYEKIGSERSIEYSIPLWLPFLLLSGGLIFSISQAVCAKRRHSKNL